MLCNYFVGTVAVFVTKSHYMVQTGLELCLGLYRVLGLQVFGGRGGSTGLSKMFYQLATVTLNLNSHNLFSI